MFSTARWALHTSSAWSRRQWPSSKSSTCSSSRSSSEILLRPAFGCSFDTANRNGSSNSKCSSMFSSRNGKASSAASRSPCFSIRVICAVCPSVNCRRKLGNPSCKGPIIRGSRYGATVGMIPRRNSPPSGSRNCSAMPVSVLTSRRMRCACSTICSPAGESITCRLVRSIRVTPRNSSSFLS